jgi:hypothetical protein
MREFDASSADEPFRSFRSDPRPFAAFSTTRGSEVPRKAATAKAAPHANASAALSIFKPLPTMPRTRPETTDKLTNVRTAESHFIARESFLPHEACNQESKHHKRLSF